MKNKLMRAATLLMVLTLMTSCFVGSTFAKYTSDAEGSDTATVAKWSFTVSDKDITTTTDAEYFTFDLFNTVKDSDYSTAETDVSVVDGKTLVAPGTSGFYTVNITNNSQVSATYAVELSAINNDTIPIEYSLVGGNAATDWTKSIASLNFDTKDEPGNAGVVAKDAGTDAFTVYWRWTYEGNGDSADTALGVKAQSTAPTVTVTAKVTATQVD